MKGKSLRVNSIIFVLFSSLSVAASALAAVATPATQVARLRSITGTVSFLPSGETQWVDASINRPLIPNDQLWSDKHSSAEIQLPGSAIYLGPKTSFKIVNLDDKISQLQVTQGTVLLNIKRISPQETYEIDTPNLALSIAEPGKYLLDVTTQDDRTTVNIRKGQATIYGTKASDEIHEGQSCSATGTNLIGYQCSAMRSMDSFDSFKAAQDNSSEQPASSTQNVSPDTIGYEDLDTYGTWSNNGQYGRVWTPNNTDPDWAPYRNGRWVWLAHWGWTWVDEQPWGFAPFHYGRWAYVDGRWYWVPGPVNIPPLYAPALIVFIGGNDFQLELSSGGFGIAWFPLAPGEVYIPPYAASRAYFTAINISNTIVNRIYINNIYNHRNRPINYRNARISNAITAVPTQAFIQSKFVNKAQVHVPNKLLLKAPTTQKATIVPRPISELGGKTARVVPASTITSRPMVVKPRPSNIHPGSVVRPEANVHPEPIHPGPIVRPGANVHPEPIHPGPIVRPGTNVRPEPIRPGPIVRPGANVHPEPIHPGPIVRPGANVHPEPIHPGPIVRPGTNVRPEPLHPAPIVRPGTNVRPEPIHPRPIVRPGTNVHPEPIVQPETKVHPEPSVRPEIKLHPGATSRPEYDIRSEKRKIDNLHREQRPEKRELEPR